MNKVFFYIIVFLIIVTILLSGCTKIPKNQENTTTKSDLEIYNAVDNSVNNFLAQKNQTNKSKNLYDAVDSSVEQFLKK